jgi:ankyrin repeat protein
MAKLCADWEYEGNSEFEEYRKAGGTPLHWWTEEKRWADVIMTNQSICLRSAIERRSTEVVSALLSAMTTESIWSADSSTRTALQWAVFFGHSEMAKLLLSTVKSNKQIIEPLLVVKDVNGRTLLHLAAGQG